MNATTDPRMVTLETYGDEVTFTIYTGVNVTVIRKHVPDRVTNTLQHCVSVSLRFSHWKGKSQRSVNSMDKQHGVDSLSGSESSSLIEKLGTVCLAESCVTQCAW